MRSQDTSALAPSHRDLGGGRRGQLRLVVVKLHLAISMELLFEMDCSITVLSRVLTDPQRNIGVHNCACASACGEYMERRGARWCAHMHVPHAYGQAAPRARRRNGFRSVQMSLFVMDTGATRVHEDICIASRMQIHLLMNTSLPSRAHRYPSP